MRRDLDVTANNIANANTAGFKGEHIVFESYLHKGGAENAETEISFVAETGSFTDDSQGALSQTGNALDVALLGKGWLSYRTEDNQIAYGRDGRFTVDTDGALVTLSGARVLDTGAEKSRSPGPAISRSHGTGRSRAASPALSPASASLTCPTCRR
ncbi:flagellar hook-basal body complex protein [Seohaeicola zhoushanensis]